MAARRGDRRRPQHPRRVHPEGLRQHLPADPRRRDRRLPVRAAPADGRRSATGPSVPPPPPRSGSGWRGWCTTACSRCSRWCSGGLRSSAPTASSWAGSPASRRCGCAAWCSRTRATWWRRWATSDLVPAARRAADARACTSPCPGRPAMLPAERRQRGDRRRGVVPEQRAPPRRAGRRGLGAARGPRRPVGGLGPRRRAGHRPRAGSRRRPPRGGSGCSSRSSAGCTTSAARRPCAPRPVRAPSGSSCRVGRGPVTIHSEHPSCDPDAGSRTSPAGSARRGGHALDERLGRARAGSHRLVGDGRRRRARPGAGPGRPRLRPRAPCSRRPAGPSYSCWSGSTATSPRPSPASCPAPGGAVPDGRVGADRARAAAALPSPSWATVELESMETVGWSELVVARIERRRARRGRRAAGAPAWAVPAVQDG